MQNWSKVPCKRAALGEHGGEDTLAEALSHIRVLDLSRVLAGPWCTQNLADFGAESLRLRF